MGYFTNVTGCQSRLNPEKFFCPECLQLQQYNYKCDKCHAQLVAVGKNTRWPKNPKKLDFQFIAYRLGYNSSSGHSFETLASVKKFILKYGDERDAKDLEVSYNHKVELVKIKEDTEIHQFDLIHTMMSIDTPTKDFLYDKSGWQEKDNSRIKWLVNANVLYTSFSFDVSHLRKLFIPKKTKIHQKSNQSVITNALPVIKRGEEEVDLHAISFFKDEQDALLYSHEIAKQVLKEKNVDPRLVEEAKLHLRHCKVSLQDVLPEYYL